ncbi:uncharacterized protein MONBRDRAFT_9932 [Monosiga brevicollis MX1]|uniref:Protein kinase domain-containing protein n=1 Tax=Monosiga brevicollis TaxID=81824 RepID=A9V4P2_MONBE|nr:uncharacterized protein MONBRDRAFT_9932 [Monosiga brevicollis MX1]EDQ87490.1 predicted protein [Monosiga brevicollis MX1]|eukprot:XP_001747750.1 hypothetical protein [Monosiga brevicollis MX1]
MLKSSSGVRGRAGLLALFLMCQLLPGSLGQGTAVWPVTAVTHGVLGPVSVTASDIDGDGDLDLVASSRAISVVAWYPNHLANGSASFGVQHVVNGASNSPPVLAVADLDNDGKPDVVSVAVVYNMIGWYQQRENPQTFSPLQTLSATYQEPRLALPVDMDRDGALDVLVVSEGDNSLSWLRNNGTGYFLERRRISTTATSAEHAVLADFDGDGLLDIFVALTDVYQLQLYRAVDAQDHFAAPELFFLNHSKPTFLAHADIDQDGDEDLVVLMDSNNYVGWLLNKGNGNFTEYIYPSSDLRSAHSVVLADVNGDDFPDAIVVDSSRGSIYCLQNNGTGGFALPVEIASSKFAPNIPIAADLDDDGDLDIVAGGSDAPFFYWYRNDGNLEFTEQLVFADMVQSPRAIALGDLDNDGIPDLASASHDDAKIAWYRNPGDGSFQQQTVLETDLKGASVVLIHDLNSDGQADVVAAGRKADKVLWFQNLGNGTFARHALLTDAADPIDVQVHDLDDDGRLDVLVAHHGTGRVTWHRQLSNQQFDSEPVTLLADGVVAIHAADLDNDGDVDVLCACAQTRTLAWFINEGAGHFSTNPQVITHEADGLGAIDTADLDQDGYLDVLAVNTLDDRIVWYHNRGSASFQPVVLTTSSLNDTGIASVRGVDLDRDGRVDIVCAVPYFPQVVWFRNLGGGTFAEAVAAGVYSDEIHQLFIGDVNQDDRPDIIAVFASTNRISWAANNLSDLRLGPLLGQGHFGTVHQAIPLPAAKLAQTKVALKAFDGMQIQDYKSIMMEAALMHVVGDHPNVVRLLAAVHDRPGALAEKRDHVLANGGGFLAAMKTVPNFAGLKFTDKNFYCFQQIVDLSHGELNCVTGPDEMMGAGLMMSSDGAIGSTYNIHPKLAVRLYKAFMAGDVKTAKTCQVEMNRNIAVLLDKCRCHERGTNIVAGIKAIYRRKYGIEVGKARSEAAIEVDDAWEADLMQALEGHVFE